MRNPEAVYDCLTMISQLGRALAGVSRLELQRSAFLACILGLYRGLPVSDWGYRFARTEYGTPFSAEIADATDFLATAGHIAERDGRYSPTDSGSKLRGLLGELSNCEIRNQFLDAACGSALAVPPGLLSRGLDNEPTIQTSEIRAQGASLLEGPAVQLLYEHFDTLSKVLPLESDLLAPSVLWLAYVGGEQLSVRE